MPLCVGDMFHQQPNASQTVTTMMASDGVPAPQRRRMLVLLVALLPKASHSLSIASRRAAPNCGARQTCPCSHHPSERGGRGASSFHGSSNRGRILGASPVVVRSCDTSHSGRGIAYEGDDYFSSSVVGRRIGAGNQYLSPSSEWGASSIDFPSPRLDEKWENRLIRSNNDSDRKSLQENSSGREEGTESVTRRRGRRWKLVGAGFALALAIGASFMAGGWTESVIAVGAVSSEVAYPLSVKRVLAAGGRAGFVVGQASVGLAWVRERIGLEPAAKYLQVKVVPLALETLKKMLLMELWRRVWLVAFGKIKKGVHYVAGKAAAVWTRYCPFWIQRGFQQIFKKAVEKRVQASAALLLGQVSTKVGDAWTYLYQPDASLATGF